jgi:hypothetical protein
MNAVHSRAVISALALAVVFSFLAAGALGALVREGEAPQSPGTALGLSPMDSSGAPAIRAEDADPNAALPDKAAETWTFLVYLDGDNNLEAAAVLDFLEMSSVGSTSLVNIVVQFDRSPYSSQGYDNSFGNWYDTKRFKVTKDMQPNSGSALSDLGELDMGNPQTLKDFIVWGTNTYPATHYLLDLWDHGGGWSGAVCWDESSADDALTMTELETAIGDAQSATGKTLSIVAFDACLMAMAENVYQIRSLCDVVVSSEETIPGYGFAYDKILEDLEANTAMDPVVYANDLVSRYIEYYGKSGKETLSAVSSAQVVSLVTSVSALASALTSSLPSSASAIWSSQTASDFYSNDAIDLRDFAERVKAALPGTAVATAADQVIASVAAAVTKEEHGALHADAHGLTIYFPSSAGGYDSSYATSLDFAAASTWDEFLLAYYNPGSGGMGDVYEPDGTWQQASPIAASQSQTHSISDGGADLDWVYFELAATASVLIETTGSTGDTEMWLYNQGGVPSTSLAYNDDTGSSRFSTIQLDSLAAGRYYVLVADYNQNDNIPQYEIRLTIVSGEDAFEPDNTYAQATLLVSGVDQMHSISGGGADIDWMRFELTSPSDVVLETNGSYGDTRMWLYDSASVPNDYLDYDDDSGTGRFSRIVHTGLPAGTYYVEVVDYDMDTEIPAYEIRLFTSVPVTDIYEPDSTYQQAKQIVPGDSQVRKIDQGGQDRDWAMFVMTMVSSVVIETSGASGDTEIWLFESSGVESESYFAYDDDSGVERFSRIVADDLSPGTYYILVSEYGMSNEIPQYRLNLSSSSAAVVPGAPTGLHLTPGNGHMGLAWSAPVNNGGAPIDHYRIYRGTSSIALSPVATTSLDFYADTGLINGQMYYYQVSAVNAAGEGPPSGQQFARPSFAGGGLPDQVTTLTANPGDGRVELSWSEPADGGRPITAYQVYRAEGQGTMELIDTVSGMSYIDSNVTNGHSYRYSVSAVNGNGLSESSSEVIATPAVPNLNDFPLLLIVILAVIAIAAIAAVAVVARDQKKSVTPRPGPSFPQNPEQSKPSTVGPSGMNRPSADIPSVCSRCGFATEGMAFCGNCGARLR